MPLLQTFKTYKTWILVTTAIFLGASAIGVKAYRSWRLSAEIAEMDQCGPGPSKLSRPSSPR